MAPAKKKIAVTGGSGELGTLVVRRLCADRTIGEVVSIDVRPPVTISSKLRPIIADVRDRDLARHLEGCDAVVHLAFIVGGFRPRAEFDDINIEGSKNVFRQAIAAKVKQLVYSSSIAAYGVTGGHPLPIVETTPRKLVDDFPYSAAKYRVEAFLDELERDHPELAIARVRPGILVGAHMENALGDLLKLGLLPDGGETPAPVVWDEDVADAVVACVQKSARGAFNVMADEPLTAVELARASGLKVLKVPPAILRGFARLSPWLERAGVGRSTDPAWVGVRTATMVMSSEKAKRELDWKPRSPTALAVMQRYLKEAPRRLDPRVRVFFKLLELASRRGDVPEEALRLDLRIHLQLTGAGGGDVSVHFDRGTLRIGREVPRPPDAVVTMPTATFLDLLAGRSDMSTATMLGKVRVEGEGLVGMYFQGLFSGYRSRLGEPGPVGAIMRRLDGWFQSSSTRAKEAA